VWRAPSRRQTFRVRLAGPVPRATDHRKAGVEVTERAGGLIAFTRKRMLETQPKG
jgi:hypothetical protein